jgi:hypothetical protein
MNLVNGYIGAPFKRVEDFVSCAAAPIRGRPRALCDAACVHLAQPSRTSPRSRNRPKAGAGDPSSPCSDHCG